MAFFTATGITGQKALINGNNVSKVIDYGTQRTIYQGAESNNYQVKDSLDTILKHLKSG